MSRSGVLAFFHQGMLKKAASGVLALLPCFTYYEYAPRVKMAAALPVEGRVLARLGRAGQNNGLF